MKKGNKNICLILIMSVFLILVIHGTFFNDNKFKATKNVPEITNFKGIKNQYFIQYNPKFNIGVTRSGIVTAFMKIHRDNLSSLQMNQIQQKLITDGWKEINNDNHYFEYCLNKNQLLTILSPLPRSLENNRGEVIHNDSLDSWTIGFYYNRDEVDSCKKIEYLKYKNPH